MGPVHVQITQNAEDWTLLAGNSVHEKNNYTFELIRISPAHQMFNIFRGFPFRVCVAQLLAEKSALADQLALEQDMLGEAEEVGIMSPFY